MSVEVDLKLFPKSEDWSTGDEAMDLKLTQSLKACVNDLSYVSVSEFYFNSINIKTRAYNPMFKINIEMVTKALLYYLAPEDFNDQLFLKLKGRYFSKKKVIIEMPKKDIVVDGLKMLRKFRYCDQLDFFYEIHQEVNLNPYVKSVIKNSDHAIFTKIIFKDLRLWLSGEEVKLSSEVLTLISTNPIFNALKGGSNIVVIPGFLAGNLEIWFDRDQIYTISTL